MCLCLLCLWPGGINPLPNLPMQWPACLVLNNHTWHHYCRDTVYQFTRPGTLKHLSHSYVNLTGHSCKPLKRKGFDLFQVGESPWMIEPSWKVTLSASDSGGCPSRGTSDSGDPYGLTQKMYRKPHSGDLPKLASRQLITSLPSHSPHVLVGFSYEWNRTESVKLPTYIVHVKKLCWSFKPLFCTNSHCSLVLPPHTLWTLPPHRCCSHWINHNLEDTPCNWWSCPYVEGRRDRTLPDFVLVAIHRAIIHLTTCVNH
jgi:hypothetical protein